MHKLRDLLLWMATWTIKEHDIGHRMGKVVACASKIF